MLHAIHAFHCAWPLLSNCVVPFSIVFGNDKFVAVVVVVALRYRDKIKIERHPKDRRYEPEWGSLVVYLVASE